MFTRLGKSGMDKAEWDLVQESVKKLSEKAEEFGMEYLSFQVDKSSTIGTVAEALGAIIPEIQSLDAEVVSEEHRAELLAMICAMHNQFMVMHVQKQVGRNAAMQRREQIIMRACFAVGVLANLAMCSVVIWKMLTGVPVLL